MPPPRRWRLVRVRWRDRYRAVALTEEACAQAERLRFVLGVMGLLRVAASSAFSLVEKVAPAGHRMSRLRGAGSPHGFHTTGPPGSGR
jgi:hypothetical protein